MYSYKVNIIDKKVKFLYNIKNPVIKGLPEILLEQKLEQIRMSNMSDFKNETVIGKILIIFICLVFLGFFCLMIVAGYWLWDAMDEIENIHNLYYPNRGYAAIIMAVILGILYYIVPYHMMKDQVSKNEYQTSILCVIFIGLMACCMILGGAISFIYINFGWPVSGKTIHAITITIFFSGLISPLIPVLRRKSIQKKMHLCS